MRHLKWLSTIVLLCLCLAGCHFSTDNDIADFYYIRTPDTYAYGEINAVIVPEQRDCSGNRNNLHYLLTLYLEGPLDPTFLSPFPKGTSIKSLEFSDSTVSIQLSDSFLSLSGMDRTLAVACLARTCFAVHDMRQVHIYAQLSSNETVSFTLAREDLVLMDGISDTPSSH